jgi:hypothetical protein
MPGEFYADKYGNPLSVTGQPLGEMSFYEREVAADRLKMIEHETDAVRIVAIILGGGTVSRYSDAVKIVDALRSKGLMR